jgi:hypothetical protein
MRLQLENGKITTYKTLFSIGGGEAISRIETKCGIKWPNPPVGGCDHLDCAIYATEQEIREYKLIIISTIVFAVGGFILTFSNRTAWPLSLSLIPTIPGLFAYHILKRQKELVEFKEYGTIKGIKASKL